MRKTKNKRAKKKSRTRKSKKGGVVTMKEVSELDDACGVAWIYNNKKINFISEKEYKSNEDYELCEEIKDLVPNEFIEVVKELKILVKSLLKCNNKFKLDCSPQTFMMWDNSRLKIKNKNNPDFIKDDLNSWLTYAFHDNSKKPGDGGNLSLEDFDKKLLSDEIDLTPNEGSMAIQIFYNRMTVPLTMLILEYENLQKLIDPEIKELLDLINLDEIKRRALIMEKYSWVSIDQLRDIYMNAETNSDLTKNDAFQMVLGTSDINTFDLWGGYFGGCQLIGFTTSVKGGGPGCSGYQWPPVRLKNPDLNCFTIIAADRSTSFTIDENDELVFKTSLDNKWKTQLLDSKPDWWIDSTKLVKIVNMADIPDFSRIEKPGIYFEKEYLPFTDDDCIICEVSIDTTGKILQLIKDEKEFYIVLKDSSGKLVGWKSDNSIDKNTRQRDKDGNILNEGSGGKMFVANPKSLFGIISRLNSKMAVAGPSGTAWYVFSTAKILSKYSDNSLMARLTLKQIETVCIVPHHSIYEVLLAIGVSPINLIQFNMSQSNREYINELYKIGQISK
tara:strand:+ start:41 stop:1717 length:1677 start_codon:yes stop_codon:yes gene_type:complete